MVALQCLVESTSWSFLQQDVSPTFATLCRPHMALLHAWGSQWNSMLHFLSCSWEEPQHPFMDILLFVVLAAKTRRAQNKQPWKRVSASLLHLLQLSVITALHDILHIFIWQTYLPGHVDDQGHIPSRRMRQGLFPCVVHIKVACKPS